MKKSVKKSPSTSQNKNKSKGKKKKVINIQGQPQHRDTPKGASYGFLPSFGAIVCSSKKRDLTHTQMAAFKKRLTHKKLRRKFRHRSQPYLQLTKKPSEVRMGKGHGVKISRTVNPLVVGSAIGEVIVGVRFRRPFEAGNGVYHAFVRAARKLPPFYRVMRGDI